MCSENIEDMDINTMNWGTELWDQHEALAIHTQKGIEFIEKYGHFIRDRCAIELDYAAKLRRLVKNHQPKKKDEEDYQYSSCRAFKAMLGEVGDLAGQHETVAEELTASVLQELSLLVRNLKDERKKHLSEEARMRSSLVAQLGALDRAKKSYEKASKEAERALDEYQRADADLNLSRAVVEKARMNMVMRTQQCEDCKSEYANQLHKTNELQHQHYAMLVPEVLRQMQELDERRVRAVRGFMVQAVKVERSTFPIREKCLDGIVRAADEINEKEDTQLVIERYKSGFLPPEDIQFEDLNQPRPPGGDSSTALSSLPAVVAAATVKGTLSAGKHKKRVGLFGIFGSNKNNFSGSSDCKEDYADLPPMQRRKRLQQKLDEIAQKMAQETAARDGLMKMKGVYEANSALGDPMSIEGQLHESGHRLDKLRTEQHKYQTWLEELQQQSNAVAQQSPGSQRHRSLHNGNNNNNNKQQSQRHSSSDESTSPSEPGSAKPHPHPTSSLLGTSSHSPESGLGSRTSLQADSDRGDFDPRDDSIPDADAGGPDVPDTPLTPLGTCKALYAFEATSEGSIPMLDGEELLLLELDQGDGWTRVRRQHDMEEGFVPTSYIECSLYCSC